MSESQQKSITRVRKSRSAIFAGPLLIALSLVLVVAGGWYTDVRRPLPDPLRPLEGLQWWFTPVERNAFMRMPVVIGDLYAVDASDDGQVLWAVGEKTLIVGTTDGGRTWRRGKVLPVAAGDNESSPAAAEPKPATAAFNIIDALNPVAAAHAIDDPKQYENPPASNAPASDSKEQSSKGGEVSNSAQQSKGSTAVATPPQAKVDIVPSQDAEPNKSNAQLPAKVDQPRAVSRKIPDVAQGSPAASDVPTAQDRLLNSTLRGVAIIDAQRAIAVGENGLVLLTQDGGETWSRQDSTVNTHLLSVAFSGEIGIAVGESGALVRTNDGGVTWKLHDLDSKGALTDVAAADADHWVTVGLDGRMLNSTDGGQTWNELSHVTERTLRAVAFQNAREGIAIGISGVTLVTDDGGTSWSNSDEYRPGLIDVAFVSGRAFVIDASGVGYWGDAKGRWISAYSVSPPSDATGRWSAAPDASAPPNQSAITSTSNGSVIAVGENGWLLSSNHGPKVNPLAANEAVLVDMDLIGSKGLIVGYDGALLATADGGDTWTPTNLGTYSDLFLLQTAIGKNIVVTGRDGTILNDKVISTNPSVNRYATDANPVKPASDEIRSNAAKASSSPILDIAFGEGDRVVALAPGRVLISDDGGKTFESVRHRSYPSPWLWVACALLLAASALLLRRSLRQAQVEEQPSSITDAAASDRPIEWGDPDPAGLRDIALGLSRFLRNRRTEPPLTIAVTGEWGTGKSSLMNLLRHDLMRYGYKPVWFNAWHHQSGENLLGSLLANIHAQGVPPLHTVAGLDFRLTLLAIRGRRFWWRLTLTLFLIAVVFFSYETLGARAFELWTKLTADSENGAAGGISNIGAATGLLGIIAAVLTPIVGAVRAASAFGLQPAKLIAAVATTKHDESARIEAGARYRFAREFADFTRALDPRPLVIFIDDLDRCRAENVIEVLEAVNFLISSGRCIVVIGMARRWVETCVGLAFKELAEAHIEKRGDDLPDYEHSDASADAATEQQLFAQHYLEKLINVEIRVPRLSDSAAGAILQGGESHLPPSSNVRFGLGTALLRTATALVLIVMIGGVITLGKSTADWLAVLDSTAGSQTQPHTQPTTGTSIQAQSSPRDTESQARSDENRPVVFDAPRAQASMSWYFSTGTSVGLALLAFGAVAMFARKESRTDDSPAFREALSILQPWIMVGGSSPRSLKRFINHVRYIAMRFRPAEDIPTAYERITNRIRVWFGRAPIDSGNWDVPPRLQLSEELLVALATLHRCNESWLDELFISRARDLALLLIRDIGPQIEDPDERQAVLKRLRESIDKFNERFSDSELFENEMLDRRHAIAFYEVMAFETGVREQAPAEEAAPPRPLRKA